MLDKCSVQINIPIAQGEGHAVEVFTQAGSRDALAGMTEEFGPVTLAADEQAIRTD
jgi:hypothetical protein